MEGNGRRAAPDDAPALSARLGSASERGAGEMSTLIVSGEALSFWGGVDPASGRVIDRHHPLVGRSVAGRALVLPGSRGSCSGSGVLLELLLNGHAPAALLFASREEILTLGVIVAEALFDVSIPVLRLAPSALATLADGAPARVERDEVHVGEPGTADERSLGRSILAPESVRTEAVSTGGDTDAAVNGAVAHLAANAGPDTRPPGSLDSGETERLVLSVTDRAMLAGEYGEASRVALQVVARAARLQGASALLDVTRVHVDGCIYSGPSSLAFAERLAGLGGRVRVPTTLNALSVDRRRWRAQGVSAGFGEAAAALGDAYVAMGATPTYTCAPYLLDAPPAFGEQIAWAESNAAVHANSVLGARTQKYADFLDACIALSGRAPAAGCHLDAARVPSLRIDVSARPDGDDAFWPLLGHRAGTLAGADVPLLVGLERTAPSADDLKAFCAAFATTSSGALCHIAGVTPEASGEHTLGEVSALPARHIDAHDLRALKGRLDTGERLAVDLVALGNPHFSATECRTLARLCHGRRKRADVEVIVTMGRGEHARAAAPGDVRSLEAFGVRFVVDTCWCMLDAPPLARSDKALATNSAKYAHYAPGLLGRAVRFGNLAECVSLACESR